MPRLGFLAAIEPHGPDAGRVAAVLQHELGACLGGTDLVLATSIATADPDLTPWRQATPGWERGCDVVIDATANDEPSTTITGNTPLVAANLDLTAMASLYDEQIDDVARGVRRRVQAERRWLLPADALDVPPTALDRQLDVEAGGAIALDPTTRRSLHAAVDEVAERVRAARPDRFP